MLIHQEESMAKSKLNHWKSLISEWQESGKTRKEFCQSKGVTVANFGYWRTKIRKMEVPEKQSQIKTENHFIRHIMPVSQPRIGYTIEYPSGLQLHLPSHYEYQEIISIIRAIRETE